MKSFTILVFSMATIFMAGIVASYKIYVKVEGGLKGCTNCHFQILLNYITAITGSSLGCKSIFIIFL